MPLPFSFLSLRVLCPLFLSYFGFNLPPPPCSLCVSKVRPVFLSLFPSFTFFFLLRIRGDPLILAREVELSYSNQVLFPLATFFTSGFLRFTSCPFSRPLSFPFPFLFVHYLNLTAVPLFITSMNLSSKFTRSLLRNLPTTNLFLSSTPQSFLLIPLLERPDYSYFTEEGSFPPSILRV